MSKPAIETTMSTSLSVQHIAPLPTVQTSTLWYVLPVEMIRLDRNGMVWYQVECREGHCGNTVKTNGTHAVYSNSILVYPVDAQNDSPLSFPFSCIYPLEIESSLDVPIRPHLPTDNAVVGAKARASMFLYRNSNYTEPYPAGQAVTLLVGSSLHVGVSVDESDPELFVVVLDDCFTTESSSPDNLLRYYIIQDSCPSNHTIRDSRGKRLIPPGSLLCSAVWGLPLRLPALPPQPV